MDKALNFAIADNGPMKWQLRAIAVIRASVEMFAAALVVLEILLLASAVVARYIFHSPIIWTDELGSVVFVWLAMTGAAIALDHNCHMRLTAVVGAMSEKRRTLFECIALIASLTFLLVLIMPSLDYAIEERMVKTPALSISGAWRSSALPVGLILMIIIGAAQALKYSLRNILLSVLIVAVVVGLLWLFSGLLVRMGNSNLLVFFVVLVGACIFSGVPIAFSFGLSTVAYLYFAADVPLFVAVGRIEEGMTHLILLAVPMFIFLGGIMTMTGIADAMVRFLVCLLGHVRGGLQYVLIGAMYLVSGISGAKAADFAAIAPALFPAMKARGVDQGELVALLAATGAQTETVPPSLVLITIGSVTGVSIAALFTGGLLPALLLAIVLAGIVFYRHRDENMEGVTRAPMRLVLKTFLVGMPALILPFLIRAAVVEGVATATEVSTVGIFYCVIAGLLIYRQFDWRALFPLLVETASLSSMILIIIGTATAMAWALTQSGFANDLANLMTNLPAREITFMGVSIVVFIVLGSLLEGIPAIVLFGPLLFPVAKLVGIHEVHYAVVVILSMGIGLFSPPFGVGYYAACAVGKVSPDLCMKPMIKYLIALFIGTIVIACIPWITIGFL